MKDLNALNVEVSYFQKCSDCTRPAKINLLTFLKSDKHRAAVERIRAIETKVKRDELKCALLPGITPSGVFSYRAENSLIKHSGLIAGDVDMKDNPYTPESLKGFISGFQNVAYCGLSASGRGLWFLIPIANPERHREHFAALREQFAKEGIRLDPAPANVASFRFYSYDPAAYFNPAATPYVRLKTAEQPTRPVDTPQRSEGSTAAKVEAILSQVEARRVDITGGYSNWLKFGFSLAGEFGEAGRDYFHRVSQFHPGYSVGATDEQFTKCVRYQGNRLTIDYFLAHAKANGLTYREQRPDRKPAKQPDQLPPPTETADFSDGWRYHNYTMQDGQPAKVLLNEHGYPVAWDG